MFHQVQILGNLGRDPEMRYLENGNPVTNFSVACNNSYTRGDGTRVEETTWYRVSVFGAQAEACNKYLKKGRTVFIVGRIKPDSETGGPRIYTNSNGEPAAQFELIAQSVKFVGRPDDEVAVGAVPSDDEYDIPF